MDRGRPGASRVATDEIRGVPHIRGAEIGERLSDRPHMFRGTGDRVEAVDSVE